MASKTIKGLTIEIGGDTTKLGEALKDVDKKSRSLSSELGEINRMLKLDPGNTELLAQKQKVLADAISNTSKRLATLKEAEKQAQAQFERGEISEEQYRALQREVIATEGKLKKYKEAAEDTQKQMDGLGDESKDAGEDIKKAGNAAKESGSKFEKLGSVCKAAGAAVAASFAAVTAATAAVGAALAEMTTAGAEYADTVLTESTVTGIATDKLQEYMYAAELVDVETETLTKSMAKNIKSMKSAKDGSKTYVEAYQQLGVAVTDANGNMRDGEEVYWDLIDALGKVENETERDALAMTLLGKSAQDLNPLIEAGAERMEELGEQAHAAGYVMSDEMLNAYGALDDQIQYLTVGAEAAKNALGTVLLPVLTELATDGNELLGEFTAGLTAANGDIEQIGDVIEDVLPKAVDAILDYVPQFLDIATSIVGSLAEALVDNLPMLVDSVMDIGTTISETILSGLPQMVTTGVEIISSILDGLTSAIPDIMQATADMIPQLVDSLVAGIPQIIQGGVDLFVSLAESIPLIIPPLIEALPEIIESVVLALVDAIPQIMAAAGSLFMGIVNAIPGIVVKLAKSLPQIGTTIHNALKELPAKVLAVGADLVTGLWNGVSNKLQWLKNKLSGFADSVLSGIKSFFGVHSPSTKTAWIGEMLDRGLADGVLSNANDPIKAMETVSSGVLGAIGTVDGVQLERSLQQTSTAAQVTASPALGIGDKLDMILQAIKDGQILTIDGNQLVGATAQKMDSKLGQRRALAARGAV